MIIFIGMAKIFLNRFLGVCAGAAVLALACSEDKTDPPSHADKCKKSVAECLDGTWSFQRIENDGSAEGSKNVSGSLTINFSGENAGDYDFSNNTLPEGSGPYFSHTGDWTLDGNIISIRCKNGRTRGCPPNSSGEIIGFTSPWTTLKIRAINPENEPKTLFTNYREGIFYPSPVEIYGFSK
jgi:hypothetical protein